MTRRAWWLVTLNFLLPGSAQLAAGNRKLGRVGVAATLAMWVLVLLGIVTALMWRSLIVTLATNWFFLTFVQILLFAYVVLWVVLTINTLRLVRIVKTRPRARVGIALLAIVLLVIPSYGAAWAGVQVGAARDGLGSIFGNSAAAVPPSDGYYNVLLLGADSGDGRDSMRFDSISVVSVNADSGAATITGIPRDLRHAPFSDGSPMQAIYPDGFEAHDSMTCGWGSGMNQLMNAAEVCQEDGGTSLYPDAAANGSSPAIEATKDAAEGLLGIEIPYYVFVDMHGFADLVDALGGVDITVQERLPMGAGNGDQPVEEWATGWIEPGPQHMDGDTAQWYARSRYTTSDWDRMRRQRELQSAILSQASPENVLFRFQEVVAAGADLIDTDVPDVLLPSLVDLGLKAKEQPLQTLELTPEGIGVMPEELSADDFAFIRESVSTALHPPTPEPSEG